MHPVFEKLNEQHNSRIEEYMKNNGLTEDERLYAIIQVDTNSEPTTNWKMLEMIGIDPAVADLWTILHGLSKWNIELINFKPSNELLEHLRKDVLLERVPLIPPNQSSNEILNFAGTRYAG